MDPLYKPIHCKPAYELRWSLSLFTTARLLDKESWLAQLTQIAERDGIRILEHHFRPPATHQFLLSTQPAVAPLAIVKSIKGRLQHLLRRAIPQAFRRNFSLAGVGEVRRDTVEAYVADQLGHHRLADQRAMAHLARFQLSFPEVDLSQPQFSSHGRYSYNLHLVLVHDGRWSDVDEARLATTRNMFLAAAEKKEHRLSRLAILADHLHATLGCKYTESPEEVALGYLNNLAYAHGMTPLYQFGYFVGTFGEYDLGAIRHTLGHSAVRSTDPGSAEAAVLTARPLAASLKTADTGSAETLLGTTK
jgi:REP element-mobilizing transposase RayT